MASTAAQLEEQLRELCLAGEADSAAADKIREQLEGQADG
jgi:hypothetical protein